MFLMLITIGTGLLIASIADFTKYIKVRKRGCLTEGTIVDATTVCAETMKVYNSKWATISYKVDGKMRVAENRVLVPMGSIVGDRIMICYDRNCPSRVFNYSLKRALLLLIVATVSWGAAVMLRNTF